MSEVHVLVPIGSDIMAGLLARLADVPTETLVQWYGIAGLNQTAWPLVAPMPGVRAWQHKRPYATVEVRNITAYPAANIITIDGAPLVSPTDIGTWLYISLSANGQGQYRRITAISGSDVTVDSAFNPSLAFDPYFFGYGQATIIRDSHRVGSSSTSVRIFRHTDTPAFQSSDVGRFALFFASYDQDGPNLTRKVIAQDGVSVTLDFPLTFDNGSYGPPPLNSGFVILTGGDLPSDAVQTLEGFANGAALVPMALQLDDAPVYTTGHNYNAANAGTPYGSPLAELGLRATVGAADSTTVTVDRPIFNALLDLSTNPAAGSKIKVGPQTRTIVAVNSPFQVTVNTPWSTGPGLGIPVAGDRCILVRASVNCVHHLAYRMRSRFASQMVIAELGVIATMVSPFVLPPGPTQFSWAHDLTTLDWHPSSPASCFVALKAMLTSVKTLILGEGNTPRWHVLIQCADNDAIEGRYQNIGANMTLIRDSIRDHLDDQTVTFIMAGPSNYGSFPVDLRPAIYDQMAAMKSADPWTSYFDAREGIEKNFTQLYLSAAGQITTADRFADTLIELLDRNGASLDETSFVVEDGTGRSDSESYITVDEFRAMALEIGDTPEIQNATVKTAQAWLRKAARHGVDHLFGQVLYGLRRIETQALEWPRVGGADDRIQRILPDDEVPVDWKWAQFWFAYALAIGIDVLEILDVKSDAARKRFATQTVDTLPGGLSKSRTYGSGVPQWSIVPRIVAAATPFVMKDSDDSAGVA